MTATTPGLVCAHHHLYSALARGMPPPPKIATNFQEILEQIWWRLDTALDLEMILRSVRKTHRAIIIYDAVRRCGVGAEIPPPVETRYDPLPGKRLF